MSKYQNKIVVREGIESDAIRLWGRLRNADKVELLASTGEDPDKVLLDSWKLPGKRWTIEYEGKVIVLFGVTKTESPEYGVAWMLGSDEIKHITKYFLKRSRKYIDMMLDAYPKIFNYVDARNKISINWLKWCGFAILPGEPYGPYGKTFHPIILEKKNV